MFKTCRKKTEICSRALISPKSETLIVALARIPGGQLTWDLADTQRKDTKSAHKHPKQGLLCKINAEPRATNWLNDAEVSNQLTVPAFKKNLVQKESLDHGTELIWNADAICG